MKTTHPDIASLRASVAAFRPYLEQTLRKEQGVELLAVYVYPAQVLFCRTPLTVQFILNTFLFLLQGSQHFLFLLFLLFELLC